MPVGGHCAGYAEDGLEAEVEAAVHSLDGFFDLAGAEVRIAEGGGLDAGAGEHDLVVEPLVGDGLFVKLGAGIGRGDGDLDGMRVQLLCEANGLLYSFFCLDWKADDERAVDLDAQLAAVGHELP